LNYQENNRDKILANTDIARLIQEYVPLKRTGTNFRANCPFHKEKTPSFFVSPAKQIFHCFGCGAGGTIIEFYQRINGLTYFEAIKGLSEKYGIPITFNDKYETGEKEELYSINSSALEFYKSELKKNRNAYKYFLERSLSDDTIVLFGLGYALDSWNSLKYELNRKGYKDEKLIESGLIIRKETGETYDRFRNRVIFPILDITGKPIAFGGRVINGDSDFKYINSPETPIYHKGGMLYGLNLSKKYITEADKVYILEGYMDLITCYQFGIKNVAATLGTALTPAQIKLLSRFTKNIVMVYDGDAAGVSAMWRSMEKLLEQDIFPEIYVIEDDMDPAEILLLKGSEYFLKKLSKPLSFFEFGLKKLRAEHNANSLAGKKKIISEMINLFRHIKDIVSISELTKRLSENLNVDFDALFLEVKKQIKLSKSEIGNRENEDAETISSNNFVLKDGFSELEMKILKLLIDNGNPEIIEKFKSTIVVSDLTEPLNLIFGAIFETGNSSPGFLLDYFANEKEIQTLITSLAVDSPNQNGLPEYMPENTDTVTNDYINQYNIKMGKADSNETFQKIKSIVMNDGECDPILIQKHLENKRNLKQVAVN